MNIRMASIEDIDALAIVHIEGWRTTYKGIISQSFLNGLSIEDSKARWERRINDASPDELTFVIEEGNTIVGFIGGGKNREEGTGYEAEIFAIYLLEEAQRKGYGRKLISTLARQLQSRQYHSVMVWALERNSAIEFYKKLGGEFVRKTEIQIGEDKLMEVALGWKDLSELILE